MNCIVEMAAHAAGINDAQLAVIEKDLPACRKLIDLIVKAKPLIEQAEPLINEGLPILQQALEEIKAVQPALQIVLGVVQRELAQGHSIQQSFANVTKKIGNTFGYQ